MASRWLTQHSSDEQGDPVHGAAQHEAHEHREQVDHGEEEVRATIMRQVLVRSVGGGGKRSWTRPPIESETRKAPKLTASERAAQIATAAATAAAAAAAAVAIQTPKEQPRHSPSPTKKTTEPPTSPATPVAQVPRQAQASSSTKQSKGPSPSSPTSSGPRSLRESGPSSSMSSGPRCSGKSASSDGINPAAGDILLPASDVGDASQALAEDGLASGHGAEEDRLAWSDAESEDAQMMHDLFGSEDELFASEHEQAKEDEASREKDDEVEGRGAPGPKGKAKAKAKGKGKAAAKGCPKAKAKAAPKAKAKAEPKAKAEAEPKAKGKAEGKAQGKGQAKAKAKAKAGTAGTFAGRRPPANSNKRAEFDEMKAHYLEARLQAVQSKEEASSSASSSQKPTLTKRKFSPNQQKYWKSMKSKMQELARAGVPGAERMRIAAADWKARESQFE